MAGLQLLTGQGRPKIGIVLADDGEDVSPPLWRNFPGRRAAAPLRNQALHPVLAIPADQPLDLAHTHAQLSGRHGLAATSFRRPLNHICTRSSSF